MDIILIILAGILKAFADAQAHHRYMVRPNGFWSITGGTMLPFTRYKLNSWHVANSLAICSWLVAWKVGKDYVHPIIDFILAGCLFVLVFNFFYNKVFK